MKKFWLRAKTNLMTKEEVKGVGGQIQIPQV